MVIEQLAVKVLSRLGVYDRSGLIAEDLENVADAYKAVHAVLADDGLTTWAVTAEDIPDRFTLSLIVLIAAEIADFYHVPGPQEGWLNAKKAATNQIRRQLASGQATDTVTAEYF